MRAGVWLRVAMHGDAGVDTPACLPALSGRFGLSLTAAENACNVTRSFN